MLALSLNGRSRSLTKVRIISTARSNWRIPFSASRRAISSGSLRSAAVSATLCRSCAKRTYRLFEWSCASKSATISRVIRSFSICVLPYAKLRRCSPSWSAVISIFRARSMSSCKSFVTEPLPFRPSYITSDVHVKFLNGRLTRCLAESIFGG